MGFCNVVMCGPLPPDDLEAAIKETVTFYSARNAKWEWIAGPDSTPASLEDSLVKHGLHARGEMTGMAIDLHALSKDLPAMDHLKIVTIGDDETLEQWANTAIEGYEAPELYPSFVDLECSLGYRQPSYRRYLGFLDHQPVSTCALFLGQKAAGIYCVSTVPAARRLGIGAIITQYALREAQEMGYRMAVLQASQMGRSVYRRLGFEELSRLRGYSPVK